MADLGAIGCGEVCRDYCGPIGSVWSLSGVYTSQPYKDYCSTQAIAQTLTGAYDHVAGFCIFCGVYGLASSTALITIGGATSLTVSDSGDSTAEFIITGLGNIVLETDGDSDANVDLAWIQNFEFGATADSTSTVLFQTVAARTILNINPRKPSTSRLDWTNDSWFMRKVSASKPYTRARF